MMRTYLGYYYMAKAIRQGLVAGVPTDLLTSTTGRLDWLMDQIRQQKDAGANIDKKPSELSEEETMEAAKKTLYETKIGLAAVALGAPPKSDEFPEATSVNVVEYLDKEKTVVHPFHHAKKNLWKANAVPGSPNVNTLYWTMIYFKLRKMEKVRY